MQPCLAKHTLAPALMLISMNCGIVGKFPKFPYQIRSQPWISHMPVSTKPFPGAVCPESWPVHVLVGVEAWPPLDSIFRYAHGCYSLGSQACSQSHFP